MSRLRIFGAPLRRLPSSVAGQSVVTYAIAVCLFAAALVLASYAREHGGPPPDPPMSERSR